MRQFLLIILLIFATQLVFAEKFLLTGTAIDFKNAEITLNRIQDNISFLEEELASVTIDKEGKFKMNFELDRTSKTILRVEGNEYDLYLERGKSLNISIKKHVTGLCAHIEIVGIDKASKDEINTRIRNFTKEYNEITAKYYSYLVRGRNKALVDSVLTDLRERHTSQENDFVNTHVTYKIALLAQKMQKNKRKIFG
ncbi:MAG: hypothetical protein COB85_07355 [Bacteroidetes bacterium]|nr:MAG: hypothetical protein COB85_07355 [Bacteroidota bacterium]